MTEQMTEQEIEEARALADAATPGPWKTPAGTRLQGAVSAFVDGHERQVASIDGQAPMFDMRAEPVAVQTANAAFIAASRSLVPSLLAEVTRLRAELGHVEPVEEPARRLELFGGRLVGVYCESCGRPLAVGDSIALFGDDDREAMHWGPCPAPDLWFATWTYRTGETSDNRHHPRPFEEAYADAMAWRIAGGAALTSVRLVRVRKEARRG